MHWAQTSVAERFVRQPRIKPKRDTGKTRKEAELERHIEQSTLLKRARLKWAKEEAEARSDHPALDRFHALLQRELKQTEMPKLGVIDWDVTDAIKRLKLRSLPVEPRTLALRWFGEFIWKVTKREFGEHLGDPLPPELGGWESDYELVRSALNLKPQ